MVMEIVITEFHGTKVNVCGRGYTVDGHTTFSFHFDPLNKGVRVYFHTRLVPRATQADVLEAVRHYLQTVNV